MEIFVTIYKARVYSYVSVDILRMKTRCFVVNRFLELLFT